MNLTLDEDRQVRYLENQTQVPRLVSEGEMDLGLQHLEVN
jgi:hypothetical protein